MTVALDWDGTLVDTKTQKWLPGALEFVRAAVAAKRGVVIHSSRANSPQGLQTIEETLQAAGLPPFKIFPKPHADLYVDNQALRFTGDWNDVYRHPSLAGGKPHGERDSHRQSARQ